MKTAIQELIENLTSEIEHRNSVQATNKMYHTNTRIVQEILDFYVKPLLEKEKEQIVDAFNEGIDEMAFATSGINYYNQTYKQNK